MSVYRAARQYGVPESTLRDRTRGNVPVGAKPGGDTLLSHGEEKQFVDHVKYMSSIGYGYTKLNLQYLAAHFASSQGKKAPSDKPLSDNWFYGFLGRWPDLKLAKPQKLSMLRAQYASKEVLSAYFRELATLMTLHGLHDKPERVFNLDETGVTTEHAPPKIVCDATCQPQAVTSPRSSTVTIIGGGNAVGNYIPPYYVFPGKRWNDEFLEGAPSGSSGSMSVSGWSNTNIFQDYLTKHFIKYAGISADPSAPKTLILFDSHRSHVSLTLVEWAKMHNIILFVLPPHTSHITQPLDVAVFGPFKCMYNRECQLFLQRNPGMKITKYEVAKLTAKPYLKALSPENLTSAFRKSGIFPLCNHAYPEMLVSPASIYPAVQDQNQNQENEMPASACLPPSSSQASASLPPSSSQVSDKFFEERKITSVTAKPKKKRFVPPISRRKPAQREKC
ncbi:uncharacterized protein LOC124273117 [Haliotis rubra]|uniref:uncharacterized protein LOC124273117 n=1 Tax=Haliotis rubra TaxID=36100 RepID=UPI001EE57E87|nr:uncharacterized protein LOC124273117 [Haliotis rubra]